MPTLTVNFDELKSDFNDLEILAGSLERLTGTKVIVRNVVQIETENVPAYFMLKDLLAPEAVDVLPAAKVTSRTSSGCSGKIHLKVDSASGTQVNMDILRTARTARKERKPMRAWDVDGEPEKISKDELQDRLAKGTFKAGQRLHHPRAGWMVVTKAENPGDPDTLVELGEWKGEQE